jgi:hypothetical protein
VSAAGAGIGERARPRGREVGRYRDADGAVQRVLVSEPRPGAWEIADLADSEVLVVERLSGEGESAASADALARDWIAQRSAASAS